MVQMSEQPKCIIHSRMELKFTSVRLSTAQIDFSAGFCLYGGNSKGQAKPSKSVEELLAGKLTDKEAVNTADENAS